MIKPTAYPRELVWLAPFLCMGLMVLSLLRPLPHFPLPSHGRTVVDAEGTPIQIERPFRGTVLTWGAWGVGGYLESTHAPETVSMAGGPWARWAFARDVLSWIYPDVLKEDRVWDTAKGDQSRRAKAEIETLFAYNPGAYLGNGGNFGMVPVLRRVGLPALYLSDPDPNKKRNWDDVMFATARVETALTEHPERGEALIARYRQAYVDLDQELHTSTLTSRPRVLIMGSSTRDKRWMYIKSIKNSYQMYLPPAGVLNASKGYTGEQQDGERILAMDPDMVFLVGRFGHALAVADPAGVHARSTLAWFEGRAGEACLSHARHGTGWLGWSDIPAHLGAMDGRDRPPGPSEAGNPAGVA